MSLPPGPWKYDADYGCIYDASCHHVAEAPRAVAELLIRAEREADETEVGPRITPVAEEQTEVCTKRLLVRIAGVGLLSIEYERITAAGHDDVILFVGRKVTMGQLRKLAAALGIELKERA